MKGFEFTMTELKKLHIIQSVFDGIRTGREASNSLGISERQVWRLVARVKTQGQLGITHANKFNKPIHAFSTEFKDKIVELKLSDKYCEANISHFKDLLKEFENITISYSSLYNILKKKGIVSPMRYKEKKIHRRRKRKEYFGELIQTDATPFDWFNIGKQYSLHGYIDDASGKILGLYMCENECLMGYLEITRQMLKKYGSPQTIYSDRYSVFFPVKSQKITIEEQLEGKEEPTTQYKRITDSLGIELIPASSSQAKGRIERLWKTLQSRLLTEFKIRDIKTIEEANKFLIEYIDTYNKKFAIEPEKQKSKFIPLPSYIDLDLLLTSKLSRKIDNAGTFTINNKRFQIVNNRILPNVKVNIFISHKIGIIVEHNDTRYKVVCINNIPNTFASINLNKLCKEHSLEVKEFATKLCSSNSKECEPLLASS
ncbi:MAG: ISNCY family transposase [Bacilli bacterium]